jgi:hypothetical protein
MSKKGTRPGVGAVIGGMVAGFDQQIFRSTPPAQEMVHHARPDDPVPTADGGRMIIGIPEATAAIRSKDLPGDPPVTGDQ